MQCWQHFSSYLKSVSQRMLACCNSYCSQYNCHTLFYFIRVHAHTHTNNTHTHLMALCSGLPGWAGTRKVKPVWILLKKETVSGGGISWAICKCAPRSRQITMPAPHQSVFYRPFYFIHTFWIIDIPPSVLWHCWLGGRKGIQPVKNEWWNADVVIS